MREEDIVYEYISINVKSDLEPIYIDYYKNFGWTVINNTAKRDYYINADPNLDIVNIKFRRNRKTKNKEELKKLQEKCEKAFLTVYKLEKRPQLLATMYSLIIAIIAVVFVVVSILAIIGEKLILGILFGIIGFVGIIFPYFIYKSVKDKKEIENKTKIEEQQNIIEDTCKKARNILSELE